MVVVLPATVGLSLCFQLSLCLLQLSLHCVGVMRVETVIGQTFQDSDCTGTVCGSHVKRVLTCDGDFGSLFSSNRGWSALPKSRVTLQLFVAPT